MEAELSRFYADPLSFVLFAYPWGTGTLASHEGPDLWQAKFLEDLAVEVRLRGFDGVNPVKPIRMAVSSGHGIGKSVLAAWLVNWILCTRPFCKGTVTANTFQQLQSKTWATLQRWTKLLVCADWFEVGGSKIYFKKSPESWRVDAQTCREENSEAFAGQHAAESTSFYLYDEASNIPDKIWEVSEGGQTDGESMWFVFGNPTRRTGRFFESCFGRERKYWNARAIDGRTARFSNKEDIAEKLEKHGEDSDYFRVRVRGLPPRAGDAQYISSEAVWAAQRREVVVLPNEPLVVGIDLARGGADDNVIRFRRGLDGKSIKPVVIPGEVARDSMLMVTKIADVLTAMKPAACFIDATGGSIGGPIGDRLRQLGHKVIDVQFSGASPDAACANLRAYMWKKMRDWLDRGAIDKSTDLEIDLTAPGSYLDKKEKLLLESKEDMKSRGLDSPDDGDALALTFAQPVVASRPVSSAPRPKLGPWS